MAKFITKGKGKNRKSFPINKRKKGVSVRSVSLEPKAILKINKEQVKSINKGETANFSKALNQIVIRAKRDGIPIYDTHVNVNHRRKPYFMWIVKHPEKHDKVKGSETIVMADDYGRAIDDFITSWNKDPNRNKKTIGYPVVQGTAKRDFRFKRDEQDSGEIPPMKIFDKNRLTKHDGRYFLVAEGYPDTLAVDEYKRVGSNDFKHIRTVYFAQDKEGWEETLRVTGGGAISKHTNLFELADEEKFIEGLDRAGGLDG